MVQPFVGEIRMFGGTFAPQGWALCDGQLLLITQNEALFSLLGTRYGGDGRNTFGLPDLRGRIPIHQGTGPGLTPRTLASKGGRETVDVTTPQLPSHTHTLQAADDTNVGPDPAGRVRGHPTANAYREPPDNSLAMDTSSLGGAGGGAAHDNVMPSAVVNYIIALNGLFPSRS